MFAFPHPQPWFVLGRFRFLLLAQLLQSFQNLLMKKDKIEFKWLLFKINYALRAENPRCVLTLQIRVWGWKCDPGFFFSNNKNNGKNILSLHGAHFLREPVFSHVLYFELLATREKSSYFCSRFTNKLIKVYRIQLYSQCVVYLVCGRVREPGFQLKFLATYPQSHVSL